MLVLHESDIMKKSIALLLACLPWFQAAAQTCYNDILPDTPTTDFTDNKDGTVTHDKTGITWMRCALGQAWNGSTCTGTAQTYTWARALQAAETLNEGGGLAGKIDWRLPNRKELKSIVERRCYSPAINAVLFPNTPSDWFWSASPYAYDSGNAWPVSFSYANDDNDYRGARSSCASRAVDSHLTLF